MDLSEALYTTRAMRRVKPDPIPDDAVAAMIDAAIRAPSGGNSQNWRFLTVSDPELRNQLGPLYRRAWETLQATLYKGRREAAEARGDQAALRVMKSSQWLADNFETVPLWVFVLHRNDPTGASVFPAVWNLMLAARGMGIGTCLTTILGIFEQDAVFELLGVPTDKGWSIAATVECGYPLGRWGVAKRAPAHEVAYAERWGDTPAWTADGPLWEPEA